MNAMTPCPTFGIGDLERMAKAIAKSGLFGIKTADQALALMLLAQAEGRHPATAARDYAIIDGRPAKKAEAMLRDFLAAGGSVEWLELTDQVCRASFSHPFGGSVTIEWTLARARKAGIAGDMWERYPRQMLRCRVISEGVRTVCPMATSGLYVEAEMGGVVPSIFAASASQTVPDALAAQNMATDDQEATTFEAALATPHPPSNETSAAGSIDTPPHRKSARRLKVEGEDVRIQGEIDGCDLDGLAEWEAEFAGRTGHLPRSWLDPIRDMIQLRREEILFAAACADMDAEYAMRAS